MNPKVKLAKIVKFKSFAQPITRDCLLITQGETCVHDDTKYLGPF